MIVTDTNIIAYLYLPTIHTEDVVTLLHKDPHWIAPLLWRSEFRNILALYVRKNVVKPGTAMAIQAQAERQMADNEYTVNSVSVMTLSNQSGCSAYDCESVSVAKSLGLKLITGDRKLLRAFPDIAVTAPEYLRSMG